MEEIYHHSPTFTNTEHKALTPQGTLEHPAHTTQPFRYSGLTFIAVPDSVEVDVIVILVEEQQTQPRIERVDGHNKQNPHYPPLLGRVRVEAQVLVDLMDGDDQGRPDERARYGLRRHRLQEDVALLAGQGHQWRDHVWTNRGRRNAAVKWRITEMVQDF